MHFSVGASSSVYARPGYHPHSIQHSPPYANGHAANANSNNNSSSNAAHAASTTSTKQDISQPGSRRASSSDQDAGRFANANIDDFKGHLYELAKDQNGCRFLQRKIEDTSSTSSSTDHLYVIQTIYDEIHTHFVELMTNSFGNYLCQKLLERCDNEQRDTIVAIVAPEIVNISLNMHGTRAVQKLIEFLSTPEQIRMVTNALNPSVVPLIKDLNGNHVIQKCLHRLSEEHRQFIYDAVSEKCIQVATHKHGCCVLQRCIDYASQKQKVQLVAEITKNALPLVQDPYGNYVVQYVLDLGNEDFSDGLIQRFVGHACHLSAQKFSSNVIEKATKPGTRHDLIAEFIDATAMEKLLRDSFANYVIQTSLDYANPEQRSQLVDCIRPLLSTVRSTPYAKRIHGKIFREQQTRPQQNAPGYVSRRLMNHSNA
ncbi:armadillo-type protein [Gongronella butleri]|nr:armadillo-type protein [Gongronella butleri]